MSRQTPYQNDNLPAWGLKKVTSAEMAEVGAFWQLPKSGFFICTEGTVTLGDQNRFYEMHPKDIIIYPLRTSVFIRHYSTDVAGTVGIADLDLILEVAAKTVDANQSHNILCNPVRHLGDKEMEHIEDLICLIEKRLGEMDVDLESLPLISLWQALCYEIAITYTKGVTDVNAIAERGEEILLRFLFSLKERIKEHRDVKYYADEQSLTPRYFSSMIKQCSGLTPSEWINKALANLSKNMLLDPGMNVKQVAYSLGFPNPSFFGKWFKHHCGTTPHGYRKSMFKQVD